MRKEFEEFVLRGNVVDLAVAVLIGVAFGIVVKSFSTNLLTPLFAAIGGKPSVHAYHFTIHRARFEYGTFLDDVIQFLITAGVIFFFVVKPLNALANRRRAEPEVTTRSCPHCLSSIPVAATRCAFCTADVGADT